MKALKQNSLLLLLIVFIISLIGSQISARGEVATDPANKIDEMVFDLKYLNRKPILISQESPLYPPRMQQAGIEGEAVLVFVVDKGGVVGDFLETRATNEEFAASAVQAVKEWKFTPGRINGFPVNCRVRIKVPFKI